jgi:hypothetical protein
LKRGLTNNPILKGERKTMMHIVYDPAFRVYRVFFGENLETATRTDIRGIWSWESKKQLDYDLKMAGLKRQKMTIVCA